MEEPLSLELVDRKFYFNDRMANFAVIFDVNLGELDRSVSMKGKIQSGFQLRLTKSTLAWLRDSWNQRDPRFPDKIAYIENIMIKHVEDAIELARGQFKRPPWDGNLAKIVAREVLQQLELYRGKFFEQRGHNKVTIPVTLAYGPYALKYLHFQASIEREKNRLDYSTYEYND
jgi:hypothetical protein